MTTEEPNQFSTPCHVTYFNDNNVSTRIGCFSDLQLAYLHVKGLIDVDNLSNNSIIKNNEKRILLDSIIQNILFKSRVSLR